MRYMIIAKVIGIILGLCACLVIAYIAFLISFSFMPVGYGETPKEEATRLYQEVSNIAKKMFSTNPTIEETIELQQKTIRNLLKRVKSLNEESKAMSEVQSFILEELEQIANFKAQVEELRKIIREIHPTDIYGKFLRDCPDSCKCGICWRDDIYYDGKPCKCGCQE